MSETYTCLFAFPNGIHVAVTDVVDAHLADGHVTLKRTGGRVTVVAPGWQLLEQNPTPTPNPENQ